ncbi:peptidoglycan DD-metalloendopeptidase family protein [Alkalibacter rhizosphaerae]|uniref:Peptidoglycan DD-metalloendopeptidase family protein n=1 Tax=Alkalibacter rhizosphaerae TaxID=2815577 RepID=A0A974XDC5_9FIRM|nr:M23 family metallopeptidase [Alkalibacter rhizosphaerae]QSX07738.1 peptidoglycan DD-metalloendopeptidase family protein [Alkalibacter rhizosphaerae]
MEKKGKIAGWIFGLLFVAGIAAVYTNHGYQIQYKGQDVGYVQDLKVVSQAFEALDQDFREAYGEDILFEDRVSIQYQAKGGRPVLDEESLKASLLQKGAQAQRSAVTIYINEKPMAVVDSAKTAQDILDQVVQAGIVLTGKDRLLEAEILDDLRLEEGLVDASALEGPDQVMDRFKTGLAVAETYEIKPKDTLWDIAVNRGMTTDQLVKANPDMDPSTLKPGDTIVIQQLESLFHIRYVKETTRQESIPFEVEYTEDDSLYLGQEKVTRPGQEGIMEITHALTFEDGKQIDEEYLGSATVKEPVGQIVARGTKAWPSQHATGRFVVPATGRILGMYGSDRGSHYHKGVDICQWSGSARGIYAADAGTVVEAVPSGYNGGRGVYVVISHGNGLSTAYYHFSSISVVKGQTVTKGQPIGIMGTTGNSRGIHLHFEVRVNGNPVDPNNYFGYFRNGLDLKALR